MRQLLRRQSLIILVGFFLVVGYSFWSGYSATSMAASVSGSAVAASASLQAPASAPPPARTARLEISPASGTFNVGATFAIKLKVNGGGQNFDTAGAVVTLTGPVTVTTFTLEPAHNGGCGFTAFLPYPFHKPPSPRLSARYLSFAGAIFGGSKSGCTVYALHLRVTGTGSIGVTLSNAGVYRAGHDLLSPSGLIDGTYNATPPSSRDLAIAAHVSPPTVKGGLSRACNVPANHHALPQGCVLVSSNSAPRATVIYTIIYPMHSGRRIIQSYTEQADVRGNSQRIFNVPYVPPLGAKHGTPSTVVLVKVSATLPNHRLLKGVTLTFSVVR